MQEGGILLISQKNLPFATNNKAELFAILHAIKRLPIGHKIKIFSDSKVACTRVLNVKPEDIYITKDAELALEIQHWLLDYKRLGGEISLEHIYSHCKEEGQGKDNVRKLNEIKNRYPNHWEIIIEGNAAADRMANKARMAKPDYKHPPSFFGSNIMIESVQGEIIQSGFKNNLKIRSERFLKVQYLKLKNEQRPFYKLKEQIFNNQFDFRLMKMEDYKMSYLQDFVFKIKFNKLLTKVKVINNAKRKNIEVTNKYRNDKCPSCYNESEDLFHFANCIEYKNIWTNSSRCILSIINSYSKLSENKDNNTKEWMPYSRKIEFFPCWFDNRYSQVFYNGFNSTLGRLGLLPENLFDELAKNNINKELFLDCSFQLYLEGWVTLRKCWLKRCKNFANSHSI